MSRLMLVWVVLAWAGPSWALDQIVCVCQCGMSEEMTFPVGEAPNGDCAGLNGTDCVQSDGDELELEDCQKKAIQGKRARAGDADLDGQISIADALFSLSVVQGLRPTLEDGTGIVAPGGRITLTGLNLRDDGGTVELVDLDRGVAIEPSLFTLVDGVLGFDAPDRPVNLGVRYTVEAVDPASGEVLPFASNQIEVFVTDAPPVEEPPVEAPPAFPDHVEIAGPSRVQLGALGELGVPLQGRLDFAPGGPLTGEVHAQFGHDDWVHARFTPEAITLHAEMCDPLGGGCAPTELMFPLRGGPEVAFMNGQAVAIPDLIDFALEDLFRGTPPERWGPATAGLVTLMAIAANEDFAAVLALGAGGGVWAGFLGLSWCKVGVIAAAAAVVLLTQLGCGAITAACAGATAITFGGMSVPCAWAIAACQAGSFASTALAYEALLARWNP